MKTKREKTVLEGIPARALSLTTAGISLTLIFIFVGIGDFFQKSFAISLNTGVSFEDLFANTGNGILVIISCFFICSRFPKSIWYTPVLVYLIILYTAFDSTFWIAEQWIPFLIGWILSVLGAITGIIIVRNHQKTGQKNLVKNPLNFIKMFSIKFYQIPKSCPFFLPR